MNSYHLITWFIILTTLMATFTLFFIIHYFITKHTSQKYNNYITYINMNRTTFLNLIPKNKLSLEIGALSNPLLHPNTHKNRILDVFDTQTLKRNYANDNNVNCKNIVNVDYVWSGQAFDELIPHERFDFVLSSHNIEHQPNLVAYFQNISSVLKPGGKLYLIIPDHRYCFDHFREKSKIHEVLAAHIMNHKKPTFLSRLDQQLLRTHNDPVKHWRGENGKNLINSNNEDAFLQKYNEIKQRYIENPDEYVDCHIWKFNPQTFSNIVYLLKKIGLIDLSIQQCSETIQGSFEFYCVMKKN